MMNRIKILLILWGAIFSLSVSAREHLDASFITCYPGQKNYQLEGHSALRLRSNSFDVAVNWGIFDFTTPGFVWRFVLGETNYFVGAIPFKSFVDSYTCDDRYVEEQPLNLTQDQAWKLYDLVTENLKPENAVYRYNYALDNCATRPLAMVEKAIGDTITIGESYTSLPPVTLREEFHRYHKGYSWYQFGIDLLLGSEIDKKLTPRQRGFAPIELRTILEQSFIPDSTGRHIPIVDKGVILNKTSVDILAKEAQESSTPSPLLVSFIILMLIAVSCVYDWRKYKISRWVDSIFFSVEGICGLIIAFFILFSSHYATSPNYIILWLNPLCFFPVVGEWVKRWGKWVKRYHIFNIACIVILIIIYITGIQGYNLAFLPLMVASLLRSTIYLHVTEWQKRNTK